jgi:multidrug efflux pump
LYMRGHGGQTTVPLGALGPVRLEPEMAGIYRLDTERNNTVQAFITAGMLPSVVLARIQERLDAAGYQVPPGYRLEIGGEAEERGEAVNQLLASVLLIIVAIMSTLVLAFSSFRIAGIIATVGLLSMGLGLAALYLWGYPFGFMAIVGTMGLVGIAINDSIVVLAGLRANPLARRGDLNACREVVLRSTRHVVATTVTTICGFLPLILSGGLFWPPLAIAIAGGVGGCTLLALYYVPALYLLALRLRPPEPETA